MFNKIKKFYYDNCDAAVDVLDNYALVNNEIVLVKYPNGKVQKEIIRVKSTAIDMPQSGLIINCEAYLNKKNPMLLSCSEEPLEDREMDFDDTDFLFERVNKPKGPRIIDNKLYEQKGALDE